MKFAIPYPKRGLTMFLKIVFIWALIGCGTVTKSGKPIILKDVSVTALPVVPVIVPRDTIHINDTPKVAHISHAAKALVKEGVLPNYDSLLTQHFAIISRYIRRGDSLHKRTLTVDSALIVAKQTRDELSQMRKESKASTQNQQIGVDTINLAGKVIEWGFWFIVCVNAIYFLDWLIKQIIRLLKRLKKPVTL